MSQLLAQLELALETMDQQGLHLPALHLARAIEALRREVAGGNDPAQGDGDYPIRSTGS